MNISCMIWICPAGLFKLCGTFYADRISLEPFAKHNIAYKQGGGHP